MLPVSVEWAPVSPRADVSMTPAEVRAFLDVPRNAVLTTIGSDGFPHAAGMWFVPGDRDVRMWTYAKSQKSVNAQRDPRCAFLVDDGIAYDELKGVLVQGELEVLTDYEDVLAIGVALYDRYTRSRLGIGVEEGPIVEIQRQATKRVGFALPLDRVASWDHSKLR